MSFELGSLPLSSSHERFVTAITPAAEGLLRLADAGYTSSLEPPMPSADSLAVAELAQQHKYAGQWDTNPIDTIQTQIGLQVMKWGRRSSTRQP